MVQFYRQLLYIRGKSLGHKTKKWEMSMSMQFYSILLHLNLSVLTVDRASPLRNTLALECTRFGVRLLWSAHAYLKRSTKKCSNRSALKWYFNLRGMYSQTLRSLWSALSLECISFGVRSLWSALALECARLPQALD
jgi:hypothetical protein